jgi:hypothetical protein
MLPSLLGSYLSSLFVRLVSRRKESAWIPYHNSGEQLRGTTPGNNSGEQLRGTTPGNNSGEQPATRIQILAYLYLAVCCLCFLATYFTLNCIEAQQLQSLKRSVYFYSRNDIKSTETAEWLNAHVGIHTLDLLSPNAGAEVHRLTGANKAANPSLVVPVRGGIQIFSTPLSVQQELQPVLDGTSPMRLGKQALIVMAALILIVCLFRTEMAFVLPLLPVIGLVSVASLWGRCLHCSFTSTPLSVYAPLAELVYLAAGMTLFTFGSVRKRWCYAAFAVVSGLIPAVQSYMLTVEPKLCPACLAVTFISAVYFVCSLEALQTSRLPGFTVPIWMRAALTAGLVALLVRHSLVFGGYVRAGEPPETTASNLVGTSLAQTAPTIGKPVPGMLYVVTQTQCGSCELAKEQLPSMHLAWHELPVCTILTKEGCFSGEKLNFATPLLLVCDKRGRIIFQQNGWVTSAREQSGLQDQIQNAIRKGTQQ